jgi:hypothetical protein
MAAATGAASAEGTAGESPTIKALSIDSNMAR